MEILERGKAPAERVYTCTCGSCGTKVRFTHGEAKEHHDQRDGDYVSIECPVCRATITHHQYTGPYS